jgi:hypothetical protein
MENMIMWAVGIVVLISLVTGAVITTIHNTCTSGWSTGEVAIWGVAGIVLIAMVIIAITKGGK